MRRACSATDIPTLVLDQPETTGPAECADWRRLGMAETGQDRRDRAVLLDAPQLYRGDRDARRA